MTAQLGDLVQKIGKSETSVQHRCGIGAMSPIIAAARSQSRRNNGGGTEAVEEKRTEETPLAKAVRDRSASFPPFLLVYPRLLTF